MSWLLTQYRNHKRRRLIELGARSITLIEMEQGERHQNELAGTNARVDLPSLFARRLLVSPFALCRVAPSWVKQTETLYYYSTRVRKQKPELNNIKLYEIDKQQQQQHQTTTTETSKTRSHLGICKSSFDLIVMISLTIVSRSSRILRWWIPQVAPPFSQLARSNSARWHNNEHLELVLLQITRANNEARGHTLTRRRPMLNGHSDSSKNNELESEQTAPSPTPRVWCNQVKLQRAWRRASLSIKKSQRAT